MEENGASWSPGAEGQVAVSLQRQALPPTTWWKEPMLFPSIPTVKEEGTVTWLPHSPTPCPEGLVLTSASGEVPRGGRSGSLLIPKPVIAGVLAEKAQPLS